jgi:hypothetical protein
MEKQRYKGIFGLTGFTVRYSGVYLEKFGAVIDSLVLDAGTEDRRAQQPVK